MIPRLAALSALVIILVGCASASAPSGPPSAPPVTIATAGEAIDRVLALEPRFAGIGARDPNAIGGCCFLEVRPDGDGFQVVFEVGWGDCQAGCINRHKWIYSVARDGAVALIDETGEPVPSGLPGAGGGSSGGGILPGGSGIEGRVLAGPVCPVVRPNDPACDDRPIPGATVLVLDARGTEVARLVTDAAGRYVVTLPSGSYSIEPQPVEGVMQAAAPVAVTVGNGFVTVDLRYDTGIR